MSKENALRFTEKQFLELILEDSELKARLEKAMGKYSKEKFNQENVLQVLQKEVVLIAEEKGVEITLEDQQPQFYGKLSDGELAKVSGGIRRNECAACGMFNNAKSFLDLRCIQYGCTIPE